ncbi:hypothetical protein M9Y10_008576 [Tritrichomonas musculus]|uniref:F5/8 type C domain-containing protein n=1 Tax=Tritrichomonas musculus TaxID=1915356 RepID=A0ABR2IZL8_9EUKA
MSDSKIILNPTSILKVPIEKYNNDFTFIVNGEEFPTSRIVADLISPKICQIHYNDPTFNEFIIQTHQKGHFSYILELTKFHQINIPENEVPFIAEIIEILDNDSIETNEIGCQAKITMNNVFHLIKKHEQYCLFNSKALQDEIDFISSHFFLLDESQEEELKNIKINTLEIIIKNHKLQLKSEDQLISIINKLYSNNSKYSFLYEYVDFSNVTVNKITEFLKIYNIDDLTHDSWKNLSLRLEQRVMKIDEIKTNNSRYHKPLKLNDQNDEKEISIQYEKNYEFDGIINYLSNNSQLSIYDAIKITSSSTYWDHSPRNAVLYDDHSKYFFSQNQENSWICFDFKKYKIIPKNYSVKSHDNLPNNCHPRSWVIEGSNDNNTWEIVDEQKDCSLLNGNLLASTFTIQNIDNKEYRFLRMRQTQSCWNGSNNFSIDSIEFYGSLK